MDFWKPSEPFEPAPGLRSGHAQTIFAHFFRGRTPVPGLRRERFTTSDGDFVDVDRLPGERGAPLLFVLHGLEGSSEAGYVRELLRLAAARGWGAAAMSFRSCTGPNRRLRSYHAGDTGDARELLARLRERDAAGGPVVGVGFSLGGNVLTKLLAEDGDAALLDAGVAVSAPFDLAGAAAAIDTAPGLGAVYRLRFVLQLRAKALAKARAHGRPGDAPARYDLARARRTLSLRAFDDAWTARVHGFGSADGYYATCATAHRLGAVRRPLLLLHAEDDPLVPGRLFPSEQLGGNPLLSGLLTRHGGHVGFVAGNALAPRFWAEQTALDFLAAAIDPLRASRVARSTPTPPVAPTR
jgi:hypothetical protein